MDLKSINGKPLKTYNVIYDNSDSHIYARKMASFLGTVQVAAPAHFVFERPEDCRESIISHLLLAAGRSYLLVVDTGKCSHQTNLPPILYVINISETKLRRRLRFGRGKFIIG